MPSRDVAKRQQNSGRSTAVVLSAEGTTASRRTSGRWAGANYATAIEPVRTGCGAALRTPVDFVPLVEIEQQLADVAAMTGMASDDVGRIDASLPILREGRDDLLNCVEVGFEVNK